MLWRFCRTKRFIIATLQEEIVGQTRVHFIVITPYIPLLKWILTKEIVCLYQVFCTDCLATYFALNLHRSKAIATESTWTAAVPSVGPSKKGSGPASSTNHSLSTIWSARPKTKPRHHSQSPLRLGSMQICKSESRIIITRIVGLKCVFNKRTIKVCDSCCWQCPGTSSPNTTRLAVPL